MLNLKKTAIAVLALGSSVVFSGTTGPVCTPNSITVPCEKNSWEFGVYSSYLEPIYNADVSYHTDSVVNNKTHRLQDHNLKQDLGFRLEGLYNFNAGNDIKIDWYHSYGENENKFHAGNSINFSGKTKVIEHVFGSDFRPKWDAINVEFGQHVDLGNVKDMRFYVGMQYASIESINQAILSGADFNPNKNAVFKDNITFHGFGPRMGADINYNFGNGLTIYGNTTTSMILGDQKFISITDITDSGTANYNSGSKISIVPEMETKLGAKYTYSTNQGDLSIDTGWLWVNYFDAMHRINEKIHNSNFSIYGPYVGLKWTNRI